MARLVDQLGALLARVEILARGAEGHRVAAERALEQGRPWEAREHALEILDEMPRSRVGLALWAEAAEAAFLDHEALEALERLVQELPFRADVWLRLARARARSGLASTEALLRAAELGDPAPAADAARLALCDADLADQDFARAERWLDQLGLAGRATPAAALRRLRLALERGDLALARQAGADAGEPAPLDGVAWLARAELAIATGDQDAQPALRRALLLDAPGALALAGRWVASGAGAPARDALKALLADLGAASHPVVRAAFAQVEGKPEQALAALADGARADAALAPAYLARALESRDAAALAEAVALFSRAKRPVREEVVALSRALGESSDQRRLVALDRAGGPSAEWAESVRQEVYRRWWTAPVAWRDLLGEITALGTRLSVRDLVRDADAVERDLDRPLRVAIVGEFNAGKSSLINALLGEHVAPVGVLPTTATVSHLVWAPDRFARIERRDGEPDRVVTHAELEKTLGELGPAAVERVTLFAPLDLLRKIELIDTPGFNAPDMAHARAARETFRDVHVALWLLDATQPLKASEREVLGEIVRGGLPLLVLLNKIDRLADDAAVSAALAHVTAGLAASGIVPEAPVAPLSARLALAARRAGPASLVASRWPEIEALVERVLVEQSSVLRERALRRRVRDMVERVAEAAEQASAIERERAAARAEERELLRKVSESVARDRARAIRILVAELGKSLESFASEVVPVLGMVADSGAKRFVEDRARRGLAPAWLGAAERSFQLSPALVAALAPRYEALAAARALTLVTSAKDARIDEALVDTAALAVDELARAAEQLRSELVDPPEEPVWVRARSLRAVMRGECASGRLRPTC